jgi:hypothetical protein
MATQAQSHDNNGIVSVTGGVALAQGTWEPMSGAKYEPNTVEIQCYEELMACFEAEAHKDTPVMLTRYEIYQWGFDYIGAESDAICIHSKIIIDRQTQTVTGIDEQNDPPHGKSALFPNACETAGKKAQRYHLARFHPWALQDGGTK